MNASEIEKILRHAPRPQAPPDLKKRLDECAPARASSDGSLARMPGGTWFSRWWPALAPAAVSIACAAAVTVQQFEIRSLRAALNETTQTVAANDHAGNETGGAAGVPEAAVGTQPADISPDQAEEVARLRARVANLTEEIARLTQTEAEAGRLRGQLAANSAAVLSPEETNALEEARQKAMSIACINNLKQLGLSVRVWALDNEDVTPPEVLSMTNEMSTPKILVCPADTGRKTAQGWAAYSSANCSYEYLAAGVPDNDPERVAFRCPIHGHVGLLDGSVFGGVAKTHPERLVTRDGKLYLQEGR